MARTKGKKLKDKGKKIISLPDANTEVVPPANTEVVPPANTEVVPPAPVSQSAPHQPHALLGKRKAENISKGLPGFIFMCNAMTKPECYRYRVFGLPAGRREDVEKVKKGMKLFLYDFEVKLLYGVYEATSDGQLNVQPLAFGGRFPAQVSFAIYKECLPLREFAFKAAIKDNYEGPKFKPELTGQQVKDLLSLFRPCAALTTASMVPIPQAVVPSQAIRPHQFHPSAILPSSQDPYLAGTQHSYAAPIVDPRSAQLRVLNDPYYYAESQQPHLAEDTSQIARGPYPRYAALQQMVPRDQFASIAAGYYNPYPTTATSLGPQFTHLPREEREYDLQRENAAGYYTTYPIPVTSHGPSLHHPHVGREYELQRGNVAGYYRNYPHLAASQGPLIGHPHLQAPGRSELALGRFPVSSSYCFDGAKQVYR